MGLQGQLQGIYGGGVSLRAGSLWARQPLCP